MSRVRLQKVLARAGVASRRGAEELIAAGRVSVNGKVATIGESADPATDAIRVDGRALPAPARSIYLLLNKPEGYITTKSDERGRRTVLELVPPKLRRGLHPVGRLDYRTEGLLLLTTDGEFSNRIAHPRYGCLKTYDVKVKGQPSAGALGRIRRGMVIDGQRLQGAKVRPLTVRGHREGRDSSWWTVQLREGKTRQIREMFFRVGHPVQRLRRVAIGKLSDPRLPRGHYRELSEAEVEMLVGSRTKRKRG